MTNSSPVIVVIEDDPAIRLFLRTGLDVNGFKVFEADSGRHGIVEAGVRKPDLIILDLGLPDMDGVDVIKTIREWSVMPIIILSARSTEQQKIDALDAGADDYLTKPFGLGELLARIRVAMRHSINSPEQDQSGVFTTGALKVDLLKRQVVVGNREVHLTPIQYRLLRSATGYIPIRIKLSHDPPEPTPRGLGDPHPQSYPNTPPAGQSTAAS